MCPTSGPYHARVGDLVLVDTTLNDFTVRLPTISRKWLGERITVKKINQGTNRALVLPASENTIEGYTAYGLPLSRDGGTFIAASPNEWVLAEQREHVWLEWNGRDLSQFDSLADGNTVSSSTAAIVSHAGENWIHLSVTNSGTTGNFSRGSTALPFKDAPPTGNYRVEMDFIGVTFVSSGGASICNSGVMARFTAASNYYVVTYEDRAGVTDAGNLRKCVAPTTVTKLGTALSAPLIQSSNHGMQLGLEVSGETTLRSLNGERQVYTDTSSPHTDSGQAGIVQSTGGVASGTTASYFRNIKVTMVD